MILYCVIFSASCIIGTILLLTLVWQLSPLKHFTMISIDSLHPVWLIVCFLMLILLWCYFLSLVFLIDFTLPSIACYQAIKVKLSLRKIMTITIISSSSHVQHHSSIMLHSFFTRFESIFFMFSVIPLLQISYPFIILLYTPGSRQLWYFFHTHRLFSATDRPDQEAALVTVLPFE